MFARQFMIVEGRGPGIKDLEVSLTHEDRINIGRGWHLVSFVMPEIHNSGKSLESLHGNANAVHVFITSMKRCYIHRFDLWDLEGMVSDDCSRCLIGIFAIKRQDMDQGALFCEGVPRFKFKVSMYDSARRTGIMTLTI